MWKLSRRINKGLCMRMLEGKTISIRNSRTASGKVWVLFEEVEEAKVTAYELAQNRKGCDLKEMERSNVWKNWVHRTCVPGWEFAISSGSVNVKTMTFWSKESKMIRSEFLKNNWKLSERNWRIRVWRKKKDSFRVWASLLWKSKMQNIPN